jgi:hypothetical protein
MFWLFETIVELIAGVAEATGLTSSDNEGNSGSIGPDGGVGTTNGGD